MPLRGTSTTGHTCFSDRICDQVKVELCGEDKAALPIRAKDVKVALDLQFFQMIPGGKDVEGRQVSSPPAIFLSLGSMVLEWGRPPHYVGNLLHRLVRYVRPNAQWFGMVRYVCIHE